MITQTSRLDSGQTFLTLTVHHNSEGLSVGIREISKESLEKLGEIPEASQFLASQVSLLYVIEKYLGDKKLRNTISDLIKLSSEQGEEDSFNLNIRSILGEEEDQRKDELLNYDFSPQIIHMVGNLVFHHSQGLSSVFTPGPFQGDDYGTMEQVMGALRKTVEFIKESHWPRNAVDIVLKHTIGCYEDADAFLTPVGYLETLRERKKVTPGIDKRRVGTIPFGTLQHKPPVERALSEDMRYMSPVYIILGSLQSALSASGAKEEDLREFDGLKGDLLSAASKIDSFISKQIS